MQFDRDPHAMAQALCACLAERGIDLPADAALDIVAYQLGLGDASKLGAAERDAASGFRFRSPNPLIRIFDVAKAREFYLDFLGFSVDWEHRFAPELPLYMQVSRGGLTFHLTEHYGDATPGSNCFVPMEGVHAFQKELAAKNYNYLRPGVEKVDWGYEMTVYDPFGNRIRFCEQRHSHEE
ncbi:MAG TPA: glyoxalase superfamily protein [Rhodoblastus sp.]|nr:glyoxalase superfamily protein [Rhodoblastus sp.]